MKRRKQGIDARAWFYGSSFHSSARPPVPPKKNPEPPQPEPKKAA